MNGLELYPEWTLRAACRGASREDAELAFGTAVDQRGFVDMFCRDCWVKRECYVYARDEHGVAGGITQKARNRLLGRKMASVPKAAA